MRLSDPKIQLIILGFICFCCPGMYNSQQGTGQFGLSSKDAEVGAHAGIALGCVFAFSSLFAGALFNIMGHRLLLILGGFSYVLYVGSYLAYNYIQSATFIVIASCLLGVGAGWLWTAQGAIMMGYPNESEKGKYFSMFWVIFNMGAILGNAIGAAIQWNDSAATGANTASYSAYMIIMTIGALLTIFLLPIDKVIRKDGTHVVKVKYSTPISELKSVLALFKDWRMLALTPMFWTSNWFYNYQFTSYNGSNFSVRTRGINSMTYWGAQVIASVLFGMFLDRVQWSRPTRARYGLILLTVVLLATYAGAFAFQTTFGPKDPIQEDGVWVRNPADFHNIDLVNNTSEFLGPYFLYFAFGVTDAMYQGFSYWLMGALTNDTNQAARFAGFYKFVQNLGTVLAPVVQTSTIGNVPSKGYNAEHATGKGMGELIVCAALIFIGVIGAFPVAFKAVQEHTVEENDDVVEGEKQETSIDDNKA
ncbi:major facilitator superfamily domain-containing protein [Gamsiella multidivaricata]|uniref:major facilitator superfamily domain-containing protein n=1 Tax=Gamsiella multidivaricata TaxID=101098 RepID=UPI0022202FB7|nr:major facilitator superfamily domain-containing protein [Gamsiella multidivaricata]KAG0352542.1 hypothetical protein BGZ54_002710 [Gamsiella multidivaricata]KAI7825609.1 major facilitator superfamily domain-containing protein [Gamsiella multidivaricata]